MGALVSCEIPNVLPSTISAGLGSSPSLSSRCGLKGRNGGPTSPMKHPISYLLRTPGASLRLAGGLGLLSLAGFSTPSASASPILADLSINLRIPVIEAAPPPPRQEVIVGVSPGADFVWVGGYWDGAPGHYAWVGGHWDRHPQGRGQWSPPHWDKDRDGHYHQTKGEWRDNGQRDSGPRH
jgi:hypothetical protein